MPKPASLTRAEFDKLKAEHDELRAMVAALQETSRRQQNDLLVQFKRIAEMQAILDEERRHDFPREPNPLRTQK